MNFINILFMALGMFTILPVPKNSWVDKYTKYIALCLPFVGLIIGVIYYYLAIIVNAPYLIRCSIITVLPFVLTGFLHLDGFMDTSDALFSRRDIEKMKEILKDSNVGAFSVISLIIVFLIQLSSVYYILNSNEKIITLIFIPIVSRCIVSILLMNAKCINENGYMAIFKKDTKKMYSYIVLIIMILTIIISYIINLYAFVSVLAVMISALLIYCYVYKKFCGLSGDLCGFIITTSEVFGLFILAII